MKIKIAAFFLVFAVGVAGIYPCPCAVASVSASEDLEIHPVSTHSCCKGMEDCPVQERIIENKGWDDHVLPQVSSIQEQLLRAPAENSQTQLLFRFIRPHFFARPGPDTECLHHSGAPPLFLKYASLLI